MADLNYENRKLPNMEELDVVDENDKIIDSRPRAEVHQLGLLHRERQKYFLSEKRFAYIGSRITQRYYWRACGQRGKLLGSSC
jgi:hypothetical protein